jgi:hypothetical protein
MNILPFSKVTVYCIWVVVDILILKPKNSAFSLNARVWNHIILFPSFFCSLYSL